MCKGGEFNLSQDSLTSREMRDVLNNLYVDDPVFFRELSQKRGGKPADLKRPRKSKIESLTQHGDNTISLW